MHRHAFILLTMMLVLSCPLTARAQATIGMVDVQRLLSDSDAAHNIQQQIQSQRETFLAEVSAQEQSLRALEKQLTEEHASLPSAEFALKKEEFEKQFVETRRLAQKRKKSLDEAVARAMAKLNEELNKVVKEVAAERGYTMVLSRQNVVMGGDNIDISDEVMARLNKSVSKIALEVESD